MFTTIIALWGSALSTLLAILNFREKYWTQLDSSYEFYGGGEDTPESSISIHNLSHRTIIIKNCTFVWESSRGGAVLDPISLEIESAEGYFSLAPQASKRFGIRPQDCFRWGSREVGGRELFAILKVAGRRKTIRLKIYSPF